MTNIKLLRASAVAKLFNDVGKNLDLYRGGLFSDLLEDSSLFIDSNCGLDIQEAIKVSCVAGDQNEVQCCVHLSNGLSGVTAYLARDERLWTRLSHIEFIEYVRVRWPIPADNEKAVAHVKKHFFAKGARGIERDNAISRLWWMTEICKKVEGLTLDEALTAFLYQSDVRANIVERPTTSQNSSLLSAVVNKLHQSYEGDKSLYGREKFRSVMKNLNIEGGVRLLEVLDGKTLEAIIEKVSK